ncbi:MAG: response regulator [Chloroflexota bacterium]
MVANRILVVDDDALMRRSLTYSLERAGYEASAAASAEDALAMARRDRPDLVLLDIGLPGMDGLDALRLFRDHLGVAVILLTARRRDLDQVLGLELGADDYVTKPFDTDVLQARIKAVLRRVLPAPAAAGQPDRLVVGDLAIDPGAHTIAIGGRPVELAPREFDVLYTLALSAGRVVSVNDLLTRVWGPEYGGQTGIVYVHIRWLREKIEDDPHNPRRIVSVRGVGYKYVPREP